MVRKPQHILMVLGGVGIKFYAFREEEKDG
jgi:hypothetical protein